MPSPKPKYTLQDLIDIDQFQALQDRLNEIYSFPSAIIDNDGHILTATAWQDVCTQFHRKHPDCEKDCLQSDQYILAHLSEANPAVSYRCPRGLVDNATPIIIDQVHYGNFFTGQFFLQPPDVEFYRSQARTFGFDEEAYLNAVQKVPVWTQKQLESYLFFIKGLIEVISSSGLKKLKEIEARNKIEENEERAGAILSQMLDGFWITDRQGGVIVEVNQAMCAMLGYSREEMLTMSVKDVEAVDNAADIEQRIRQIIQLGSAHFESRFRRKDGTEIDVEVSVTYLPSMDKLYGFHRDITQRKQAEQERESLLAQVTAARDETTRTIDLLNGIMERVSDGFVAFDADFNYTYVNQFGAELLGRRVEELVGKNHWVEYPEARGTPFADAYLRAMETQQPIFFEDYYAHWDRWFINRIYPSKEGLTIFFTDITERKRSEVALSRINRELRAISDCNQVLVRADDEHTLLNDICRIVCAEAGYRMAWVGYAEHDAAQTVRPVAWAGIESGYLATAKITWADEEHGRGPVGTAIRTGQTNYAQDFIGDARLNAWRENALQRGYRSIISLPLKDERASTFASLNIYSAEPNAFTADEIRLLEELAGDLAFGIITLRARVERKRMEEALRESEIRFRVLSDDALVGIYIIQGGLLTYANTAMGKIFGMKPAEIIGNSPLNLVHPDDRALVAEYIRRWLVGEVQSIQYEIRGVCKNGETKYLELMGARVDIDNQPTIIGNMLDITERKQHEHELQAIAALSSALRKAPVRAEMLPIIVQQIIGLLNCSSITIEIIDPETGEAVVEAGNGPWKALVGSRHSRGPGIGAIVKDTIQPYASAAAGDEPLASLPDPGAQGIHNSAGVPLIAQEKLIGFIWVGGKAEISDADVRLLSAISDITANALHRATLHEQTQEDAAELSLAYDTTLEGWARALEMRDQDTEGHTRRVTLDTVELARLMGVKEEQIENVRRGALLHDIGKMGIPDAVLNKRGTFDEREWEIMRRHPEYAVNFLHQIEYLRPALSIPYCHHEKWDGSGYPRGLKGEEIPLEARIFAIVDVWDALTNDRIYRRAWSQEDAVKYIEQQSGKHFDPQVVAVFIEKFLVDK